MSWMIPTGRRVKSSRRFAEATPGRAACSASPRSAPPGFRTFEGHRMDTIVGIDLGTTNSEVAVIQNGRPVVLEEDGEAILPSVVGLDPQGRLLVGLAARNQFVLAPDRTVRSIKRKMGEEITVSLGDKSYTPQEISAILLRTLKQRAEQALGQPVKKAV